jgi:hypothetical protein
MSGMFELKGATEAQACHCIGPQNGCPVCPCEARKRGIFQRDGRWIEPARPARGERDLGPVWRTCDDSPSE